MMQLLSLEVIIVDCLSLDRFYRLVDEDMPIEEKMADLPCDIDGEEDY